MDYISYRNDIREEYQAFLNQQASLMKPENSMKIDLHCHDKNSAEPDELWGRILRIPETWLETDELVSCLDAQGCDVITVTNHNNALSCWQLQQKGKEVLSGGEFTCKFPEYELSVHVLVYGLDQGQEKKLNRYRKNIYRFLKYCREEELVVVLPHPLFFYQKNPIPYEELFEKFAVLFERFEVLNGQRDVTQNLMTVKWIQTLTKEKIERWAAKHQLNPYDYCLKPYVKRMTGGSDDHNGFFAGTCGTLLDVSSLNISLEGMSKSEIALEVLRSGTIAPYGYLADLEKLNIALLDYFSQVALNIREPGLIRMMLHKGSTMDKLMCFGISNFMQEMQRHNYTMKFFRTFHEALLGKRPGLLKSLAVARDYRPCLVEIDKIARARKETPDAFIEQVKTAPDAIFKVLMDIITRRTEKELIKFSNEKELKHKSKSEIINKLEIPSQIRNLLGEDSSSLPGDVSPVTLTKLFDELSFPILASMILGGAALASSRALFGNRPLLNRFSKQLNMDVPERVLWLTDTFQDQNGVSSVLQTVHQEVKKRNLAIDFLVCDQNVQDDDHLKVLSPLYEFPLKEFGGQVIRIPDLMEIQKFFYDGGYDRIICSTELLMGAVALYLKESFSVPVYFYMHTDWMDFLKKSTDLNRHARDRVRRILRMFYQQYTGVFTLNTEHKNWLTSDAMQIPEEKVFQTAHWVEEDFHSPQNLGDSVPFKKSGELILLFAGRLSKEKGVLELPKIYRHLKEKLTDFKFVIAGSGPELDRLKEELPEAEFPGWIARKDMPSLYAGADLLIMPSRFDTFGCVVLEALSCGLPVAAYDSKGPADIIEHNSCGVLAKNSRDMAEKIAELLKNDLIRHSMKEKAIQRGKEYSAEKILNQMLEDIGMHLPGRSENPVKTIASF